MVSAFAAGSPLPGFGPAEPWLTSVIRPLVYCEREFNRIEMEGVVIGVGRVVISPGVTTRRIA